MAQAILGLVFSSSFLASTPGLFLTGVVNVGLSLGIGYVANELFGPEIPKPEDVQGLLRQSVSPRMRHYGRVKVGGAMAFVETRDGNLYMIVLHGQGPIDAYEEVYLDDRLVALDGSGGVTTDPYDPGDQIIRSYLGTTGQTAASEIVSAFPGIWTSDHRLRGIAYSTLFAESVDAEDVQEIYPNRIPVLTRVVRAAKCYDPRDGQTNFTRNAALILRDYLTHPDGLNLPSGWMDDGYFGPAAGDCGENVTTKDGSTISRYNIGLSYSFNEEPKAVINRILQATDGRLFLTGEGKIAFLAGKWKNPTVKIRDEHIIGYELTDGSGPFREANEVIIQYTQVPVGYKQATSDPWRNETSISNLGDIRSQTVQAYEIQHHNHARRIAKILERRANPRWVGSIQTNLHGLNAWDQRWIEVEIGDLDIDETFEITGPPQLDAETMTVVLPVQSFSADAYDFNPATEEGVEPTIPEEIEDEDLPLPQGVVTGLVHRKIDQIDFTYEVYNPETETTETVTVTKPIHAYFATIKCDAPPREGLQAEAQFSVNGGSWDGMAPAAKGVKFETPALPRGSSVAMRIRWRTNGGGKSDWVNGATQIVPA